MRRVAQGGSDPQHLHSWRERDLWLDGGQFFMAEQCHSTFVLPKVVEEPLTVQILDVICRGSVKATLFVTDDLAVTASSSILHEREVMFDKRRVGMSNHRQGISITW